MDSSVVAAVFGLLGVIAGGVIAAFSNWLQGERAYKNSELAILNDKKRLAYERAIAQVVELKIDPDKLYDEAYRAELVAHSGVIRVYAEKHFAERYLHFGQAVFDAFHSYSKAVKEVNKKYFSCSPIDEEADAPSEYEERLIVGTIDEYDRELEKMRNHFNLANSVVHDYLVDLTKDAKRDVG